MWTCKCGEWCSDRHYSCPRCGWKKPKQIQELKKEDKFTKEDLKEISLQEEGKFKSFKKLMRRLTLIEELRKKYGECSQ